MPKHIMHPGVCHDLARTVWPTVPSGPLVLVPLGSLEQHGPHLPLNTDSVIAQAVAHGAAAALSPGAKCPALIAPTLSYGASGEHAGFRGTVSIGCEALHAVLVETVRSLALWAGRVIFVNGHGGNTATLADAGSQLRAEGHDIAWTCCDVPGGDAHAGRTETSVMLHLAPADVRMDAAVVGDTRPLSAVMPDLMAHGVRVISPSGVLGDPTGASADEGAEIMAAMVSATVRRITHGVVNGRGRLVEPVHPTPAPKAVPTSETEVDH